MGIHDRDWYRDEHKQKAKRESPGPSPDKSSAHKQAAYDPRMFRGDRSPSQRPSVKPSSPPEPHQWPTWAVVLIWMFIAVFAAVIADRFNSNRKAMVDLERQLMNLKDCDYVASGPCMKLRPQVRR